MASKKQPKDHSASRAPSKKLEDLPFLKRHVGRKENEVLHALANLVCEKRSASLVLTTSQLAASMSMLSEEHHQVIGHGQKDLQKFLQKHSDIFTVQGGTISVKSSVAQLLKWNDDLETPVMTDSCLQQILGTVTKVLKVYGFIITTNGCNVYFSANVFEGGNAQDLMNHVSIGDKVVLDAEKSGPTYAAEWKATKVRKLRRQYSSSRDSWSGSCSSLDKIDAVENRWVSLDSLSSDVSKKSTTPKKNLSEKLGVKDREIIMFLQNRLRLKNNSLSIQNLTGHLSGLPSHLHTHLSGKRDCLRTYIRKHESYFNLEGDVVSLKNVQIISEDDKESDSSENSSNSNLSLSAEASTTNVRTKVRGKVLSTDESGSGFIILITGEMVQFTSSFTSFGTKKPFSPNDSVVCNAVLDKDDWKATNVWHQTSTTSKTSFQDIESPQVTGYRGKIVYIYPTYGIIRHGISDDENIYFHKDVVVSDYEVDSLSDILTIGDEVLCDAVKVTNYTCRYRALRVIPLDDKDDTFQLVSRKAAKTGIHSTDTTWSTLLKASKTSSGGTLLQSSSGNPLEEVYVSDDEWDNNEDGDDEKLVNCTGRVVSLKQNCGFIQRGKTQSFKDPENVYFNNLAFCMDGSQTVTNLLDVLSPGDTVYYDAVRGYDNASCKWRAEVVWKDGVDRKAELTKNGEVLCEREGKVIKIYPSKGLISFGPHPYLDRVFFSKDVFFHNGLRHWNLAAVLKAGDPVKFDAECDVAGQNTKWKASRVWVDENSSQLIGNKPGSTRNPDQSEEQFLLERAGHVVAVFPSKGVIMFGSRAYFEEVFFTVDVFYDNGCTVHNLQQALKVNDKIKFDAKVDRPEQRTKWKALLVWKGQRPNISSAAQHHFQFCDFLQPYISDFHDWGAEDADVEIINTRGKTIQQISSLKSVTTRTVTNPRRNSNESDKSTGSVPLVKTESESLKFKIRQPTQLPKANTPNSDTENIELSTNSIPVISKLGDSPAKLPKMCVDSDTQKNGPVFVVPSVSSPSVLNHKVVTDTHLAAKKELSESAISTRSNNTLDTFEDCTPKEIDKNINHSQSTAASEQMIYKKQNLDPVTELTVSLVMPLATGANSTVGDNETINVKTVDDDKIILNSAFGRTGAIIILQNNCGFISTTVGEKDKFENVQLWFSMDNVYVNGIRATESSLAVGETVHLNANQYLYASTNDMKWEATMVWKGRKPRFLSVSSGSGSSIEGPSSPSSLVDSDLEVKKTTNIKIPPGIPPVAAETAAEVIPGDVFAETSTNIINCPIDSQQNPLSHGIASALLGEANDSGVLLTGTQTEATNKVNELAENSSGSLIATDLNSRSEVCDAHVEGSSVPDDFTLEEDIALEEMLSKEIDALVEPHISDAKENVDGLTLPNQGKNSTSESSSGSSVTLSDSKMSESKELVPWDDDAPQETWICLDDTDDKPDEIDADQELAKNEDSFNLEVNNVSEVAQTAPNPTNVPGNEINLTNLDQAEKTLQIPTSANLLLISEHLKSLWPSHTDRRTPTAELPEPLPSFGTSTEQSIPTLSGSVDFSQLWLPSQVPTTSAGSFEACERSDQVEVERAWLECFDILRYLHNKTKEILQRTPSHSTIAANDSVHQPSAVDASNQDVLVAQPRTQPKMVTVATQTIFTGDFLCNTIYSGE